MSKFILQGHVLDASLIWKIDSIKERNEINQPSFFVHPHFTIHFLNGTTFTVKPSSYDNDWIKDEILLRDPKHKLFKKLTNLYNKELVELKTIKDAVAKYWAGHENSLPILG